MTAPVSLSSLIDSTVRVPPGAEGVSVRGLALDSRKVQAGFVFAALSGAARHGKDFIEQAVIDGASAVLLDDDVEATVPDGVAELRAPDARRAFALMASRFFGRQPHTMVAVTGTSGKTSVASFTRQIFQALGHEAAAMGTLGITRGDGAQAGALTTPDSVSLHEALAALADDGVTHMAMEASSHGLEQRRLDGVRLEAAAFTNLGRDHLDYHPTMEDYFTAKSRLFDPLLPEGAGAVVWLDDAYGERMARLAKERGHRLLLAGMGRGDVCVETVRPAGAYQEVGFRYGGEARSVTLPLPGLFQVANAMVAAGLVLQTGGEPGHVFSALEGLKGAKGRLEHVGDSKRGGRIFVDYAHKPGAVEEALKALRPFAVGRVVIVVGAGGDRDRGKRPLMGKAAATFADAVIVTDDNPRTEDPATIRKAVLDGAPDALEIGDRADAIQAGMAMLDAGDVLLIAGKGHETGQEIHGVKHPFSDHDFVRALLSEGA
ncbi:MAG: UDP-N-acetylmuramoyl-L-alanyl-D-glutamate--2,6-diaminopimelate ligase [Devosiaceae bacterium]|nr:UDP-N-acetylmuramoyl-L-alanyl-D-glutamate--2,6-diaminopimelate ligase [Devosiaceae bacterium MH13]